MENWRKFINEATLTDPTIAAIVSSQDTQDAVKRSQAANRAMLGDVPEELFPIIKKVAITAANIAAMAADPSGQFAGYDPDTKKLTTSKEILDQEILSFQQKPTLTSAASVAVAGLSMLPILGGVAKLGRLRVIKRARAQFKPLDVDDPMLIRRLYQPGADGANMLMHGKKILLQLKLKYKKNPDPQTAGAIQMLAVALNQVKRGVKDLHKHSETFGQSKIKGSTISSLTKTDRLATAGTRFGGKVYKGKSVDSLSQLRAQINLPSAFSSGGKLDFAQEALKQAQKKRGQWVKLRVPEGTTVPSTHGAGASTGEVFTKSLDNAKDLSSGALPGAHAGRIEVMLVASGKKVKNIDAGVHFSKTGLSTTSKGPSITAKSAEDVVMLGDNIPIDQIWIKIN